MGITQIKRSIIDFQIKSDHSWYWAQEVGIKGIQRKNCAKKDCNEKIKGV